MARECIAARVRLINRVITGLYDDALRPFGMKISQANILSAVAYLKECRPADVCRVLRIEKSTLSRDLDLMKRNGWLVSEPPEGGRNQIVRLSPQGARLLASMEPSWEAVQAEVRKLIGDDGERALLQIAGRLGFGRGRS
jgi:DNA-binding MarR family transcriptional regulator